MNLMFLMNQMIQKYHLILMNHLLLKLQMNHLNLKYLKNQMNQHYLEHLVLRFGLMNPMIH
tara:strand:- start:162 stop:344 length:183 start_codon:yes stop_codon:yes gene_type:complete